MIPDSVRRKFQMEEVLIEQLANRVAHDLRAYCDRKGYPFSGRKKQLHSVSEKIETGRYATWSEIDDLYGCSIIVPNLLEEPTVVEELSKLVHVIDSKIRGSTIKSPEVFRFDSTRLYCKLIPNALDSKEMPIYQKLFEIQVRTAFEYAWSSATHNIVYKGDKVDWGRVRLACQLKAMVEQMDTMILGFDQLANHISTSQWPELEAQQRILDEFKKLVEDGHIPSEACPQDWTRFCNNVYSLIKAAERAKGVKVFDQIDPALQAIRTSVMKQSGDKFPRSISLFQFCLGVLVEARTIASKFHDYTPMITSELVDLYVSVSDIPRFDLQL